MLLGFTDVFTRSSLICGFRLEAAREGELDFVLYEQYFASALDLAAVTR